MTLICGSARYSGDTTEMTKLATHTTVTTIMTAFAILGVITPVPLHAESGPVS